MLITSCKGLKVINLRVHVCMWKYYETFEIRRRSLAPGPHMVSSMGGASTSAIFTPEVGINYPRLSPIIRRQRYLNSHLLPNLPQQTWRHLWENFGSCEPQTWLGASHSGACETFLGGPEIPQSLAFIKVHLWMFPRHYGRGFNVYSLPPSTLMNSI